MARRVKPSLGCGYVVVAVLMLAGLGLAGWGQGAVARSIGAALVVAAVVYQGVARRIVREFAIEEQWRAGNADKPWLWQKAWREPAIFAEDGKGVKMIWLFTGVWNAVSLPGAYGVLTQQHHDKAAYFVFLFPLVGLGLLTVATYKTLQWRKYGRTRFMPTSLPGVIGSYLGGVIEVPARVVVEKEARVALRCVRRVETGSGKNRRTVETILWEREERIPPEKWLSGAGRTDIPVLFHIPAGSVASDPESGDNEVLWRLSAEAATPGVDFKTVFVVPVFATGEVVSAAAEDGRPTLDVYEPESEFTPDWVGAGIERGLDGYRFGTRHLRMARWIFTAISAGLLGLFGVFWSHHVPWVAWVVVGIFAAIMLFAALDLWCGRFELRLVGDEVLVRKPRPWGTREWRVPAGEVVEVRTEPSVSIGTQAYFRIVLVGKPGADEKTAASGETFRARKLRYQLGKTREAGGDAQALIAALKAVPRFEVTCAGHVPGPAMAKAVAADILACIKKEPRKI
jgi:hypothetical protein